MSTVKRVGVIFGGLLVSALLILVLGGDGLRSAEPGFHPAKAVARGTPVTLKTWGVHPRGAGIRLFPTKNKIHRHD